jgi:hypothetical protein
MPKERSRSFDVIGNTVRVMRIATSGIEPEAEYGKDNAG